MPIELGHRSSLIWQIKTSSRVACSKTKQQVETGPTPSQKTLPCHALHWAPESLSCRFSSCTPVHMCRRSAAASYVNAFRVGTDKGDVRRRMACRGPRLAGNPATPVSSLTPVHTVHAALLYARTATDGEQHPSLSVSP